VEVVTFTPYSWFQPWQESNWRRRGSDYDTFKKQLSDRLQEELIRQVPVLAGKIDYAELSTPLSTRHFMNYQQGEMYGLSGTSGAVPAALSDTHYTHSRPLFDRPGRNLSRRDRRIVWRSAYSLRDPQEQSDGHDGKGKRQKKEGKARDNQERLHRSGR
jgi:hypothetical protein